MQRNPGLKPARNPGEDPKHEAKATLSEGLDNNVIVPRLAKETRKH